MTGQSKRAPQMKWLRLYHEARTDAKLESLPDDEFRVWFRLLCFAGAQPERGVIANVSPRLLAVEVAHGDVALLQRTLISLAELCIIKTSDDAHAFIHWNKRQFASDNVTERVLKHRESAKKQDETFLKRFSNGDVTIPDNRYRETDTESETDTVTDDSKESGNSIIVADALASGDDDSAPHAPDVDVPLSEPEPTPDVISEKPTTPAKIAPDAPAMRLAIQLREAVLAHNSTALDARKAMTGQGIQAWARKIEALISDPRRAPPDVEAVIAYATSDTRFWQAIVLNPDKLKKHFDTINGQRLNARSGQNGGNGNGRQTANAAHGRSAGGGYGSGSGNGRAGTGGASHPPVGTPEYIEWARARDAQLGIGVSGAASGPRTRASG